MILWFNCKISDIRPNPQPRYNLREDNRFDIAKYSFASYVPLLEVCSKVIFNLEMADGFAGREQEMEDYLRSIFPERFLVIKWYRCNNISQWRELQKEINEIDDDLIFPAGNEDHIFIDNTVENFRSTLRLLTKCEEVNATFMTSHWQESIRAVNHFKGQTTVGSAFYNIGNNDALRVMKKEFFNWYIDQVKNPDMLLFRTEHWNSIALPENRLYVPFKEQFRHFDGYGHVGIGPEYAPPLEIPPGFFENNIVIKYGFTDRDPDCVNINPTAEKLYAEDKSGTDYRWCLEDIPLFWKTRIKEIITAPDIDEQAMKEARDNDLLIQSRLHFDWPHFGIKFDDTDYPPVEWLNPYMLALEFAD